MDFDEKDWFMLFNLAKLGALKGISLTTQEIANIIGSTQQTVSRRIKILRELQFLEIISQKKKNVLRITTKGLALLKLVYTDLEKILYKGKTKLHFYGYVQTGMGEGKYYVSLPNYFKKFSEYLGEPPFLGTLNIVLEEDYIEEYYMNIKNQIPKIIEGFKTENRTFGDVNCYDILVCPSDEEKKWIKCLILDIRRTSHKRGTVEIVSNFDLRDKLNLEDGAKITIKFAD